MHTHATIVAVGDELTLGQRVDTNSAWISGRLAELGVHARHHVTVDDDAERLTAALRQAVAQAPLVVVTGGLGPTADDLTREALARATGDVLLEDAVALEAVRAWFAGRGTPMPEPNRVQALRPGRGRCLANPHGTAPGLHVWLEPGAEYWDGAEGRGCDVFALPGPPAEMKPMFEAAVAPAIVAPRVVRTRLVAAVGLGESAVAERLGVLMARDREPLVGTTASGGIVSVRMREERSRSEGRRERDARGGDRDALDLTEAEVRRRLGACVFTPEGGTGEETLAAVVLELLRRRGERLVVAESCTGGGLGAMLTDEPGASDVFVGGVISYSNELKTGLLGVGSELLATHGAVSEAVARAMAEGALGRVGGDRALAITGVAGPGGGSAEKPVGAVWIAAASRGGTTEARRFLFRGGRQAVRDRAALMALAMLRLRVVGASMRLLGEVSSVGA